MLHIFVFLVLIAIIAPALVIVPQSFTCLPDKGILPQVVPEVLREPRVDHLA